MSIAELAGGAAQRVGAAKRRRGRQLRAVHRHEVVSVKLALATALHHSAHRPKPVMEEPEEEELHETHDAPRGLGTPPPEKRRGILAERGPQQSVSARCLRLVVVRKSLTTPLLDSSLSGRCSRRKSRSGLGRSEAAGEGGVAEEEEEEEREGEAAELGG